MTSTPQKVTGRPSKVDADALQKSLTALMEVGTWRSAALAMGYRSEQSIFNVLAAAKAAADAGDKSSPYWCCFRGEWMWYRDACSAARSENIAAIEGEIRSAIKAGGTMSTDKDPSTNRPIQALRSDMIGRSDDEVACIVDPLDPDSVTPAMIARARLAWEDPETQTRPIWQQSLRPIASATVVKGLSGLLPKIYGERIEISQTNHTPVQRFTRRDDPAIVDASFTVVSRPDIQELVARAKAMQTDTSRVTAPSRPPNFTGAVGPSDDAPEYVGNDHAQRADVPRRPWPDVAAPVTSAAAPVRQTLTPDAPLPNYIRRKPGQPIEQRRKDQNGNDAGPEPRSSSADATRRISSMTHRRTTF